MLPGSRYDPHGLEEPLTNNDKPLFAMPMFMSLASNSWPAPELGIQSEHRNIRNTLKDVALMFGRTKKNHDDRIRVH